MPVYHPIPEDEAAAYLAAQMQHARKQRGWTLKELAARVPASIATLSSLENRRVSIDVDLLFSIAEALETTPEDLLGPGDTTPLQITRGIDVESLAPAPLLIVGRRRRSVTPYHNRLWPLAEHFSGKFIEPFTIEIQPVRDRHLKFISHTHEEFVFVLEGEVELLLKTPKGLARVKIGAGECVYFWSYYPHCLRSTRSRAARSVHVLSSLDDPLDSETGGWATGAAIYMMEAPVKSRVEQVADRIVSLRRSRGMSATIFARNLGITARRLARIERGDQPLPVRLLLQICRIFRKPAEYFVAAAADPRVHYAVDTPRAPSASSGRRPRTELACFAPAATRALSAAFERRRMFPYLVTLGTSGHRTPSLHSHAGQEFVYVLAGQMTLTIRHNRHRNSSTMAAGDSCLLDSRVAHAFVNRSSSPYSSPAAKLLVVRWSGQVRP